MPAPRSVVFLMYHELEVLGRQLCQFEPGYIRYIVSETDFRSQMSWLQESGWRGVSVGEALAFRDERGVAITFDDGTETDLLTAAPLLESNGHGATFFVTVGYLGKPGYLSTAQVKELAASGFEIGCHSMSHRYLSDLDSHGLQQEIVEAKQRLEGILGKSVQHFSCPGGRYDSRVAEIARNGGYQSICTSRSHANSALTDRFSLGRVTIRRRTSLPVFQQFCRGEGLWKIQCRETLRNATKTVLGNSLYDRIRGIVLRT